MKHTTIDDFCKAEPGSFKKFIKEKEAYLEAIEIERKERIHTVRLALAMPEVSHPSIYLFRGLPI